MTAGGRLRSPGRPGRLLMAPTGVLSSAPAGAQAAGLRAAHPATSSASLLSWPIRLDVHDLHGVGLAQDHVAIGECLALLLPAHPFAGPSGVPGMRRVAMVAVELFLRLEVLSR